MLAEYALIPDIFDGSCYSTSAVCDVHLQNLKEVLLNEALVRDMRNGEWSAHIQKDVVPISLRAKELIKKLVGQNRLRRARPAIEKTPEDYKEWCEEAIASHDQGDLLTGIIATNSVWESFRGKTLVASIEKLPNVSWWQSRSCSCRIKKETKEYVEQLHKVFRQANSIMFIDPHIDPTRDNYKEFLQLLLAIAPNKPLIEIHRVWDSGSGHDRTIYTKDELHRRFASLNEQLINAGLTVKIYVWPDFHDRYLITDVMGLSIPYGFDISTAQDETTTWTRLSRLTWPPER